MLIFKKLYDKQKKICFWTNEFLTTILKFKVLALFDKIKTV